MTLYLSLCQIERFSKVREPPLIVELFEMVEHWTSLFILSQIEGDARVAGVLDNSKSELGCVVLGRVEGPDGELEDISNTARVLAKAA